MDPIQTPDPAREAGPAAPQVSTYESPYFNFGAQDAVDKYARQQALTYVPPTTEQVARAAYEQTPYRLIESALQAPTFKPDPTWTYELHSAAFDEEVKSLPKKYHRSLEPAVSMDHFRFLAQRARHYAEAERHIEEAGLKGLALDLFSQVVDPINIVTGAWTVKVLHRLTMNQALLRRMGAQAAGGAGLAVGSMVGSEQAGMAYDVDQYLYATGFGIAIGGLLGPSAGRQLHVADRNRMTAAARGLIDLSLRKKEAAEAVIPTHQAVKEAIEAVPPTVTDDDVRFWGFVPHPEGHSGRAAQRADVAEMLQKMPNETRAKYQEYIDNLTKARATPEPRPNVITELEPTEAHLKAKRFVSRYEGPDGNEYRIMAQTDDISGPFKVEVIENGKQSPIIKDLDDIQSALAHIKAKFPDAEVAPPRVKEEAAPAPKAAAPEPTRAAQAAEGPLTALGLTAENQALLTKLPGKKMTGKEMHRWLIDNGIRPKGNTREEMSEQIADAIVPGRVQDGHKLAVNGPEAAERNRIRGAIEKRLITGELDDIPMPVTKAPEPVATPEAPKAQDAGAAANPAAKEDLLNDNDWKAVTDDHAPETAFARIRRDAVARLNSAVPQLRLVSNYLLNDVVGKVGHQLNRWSTDLEQQMTLDRWMTKWDDIRQQAFYEWVNTHPEGRVHALRHARQFHVETARYVKNPDARPEDFNPAVVQLGEATKRLMKDILEDMKDPGRALGKPGEFNPVLAADEIEFNQNYLWRHLDDVKLNAAYETYGKQVDELVKEAIRRAQPDIDPNLLERLATTYVANIRKRSARLGDDMIVALGEGRRGHLAAMLRQDGNYSDEEIDFLMRRLFKNNTSGDNMHTKRRVLLDERASIDLVDKAGIPTGQKLHFHDILNEDVNHLVSAYARRMSGRVALARTRIVIPGGKGIKTRLEAGPNGQMRQVQSEVDRPDIELVDGFDSIEKIDQVMERLKAAAHDYHTANPNTYTTKMRDQEIADMQYAFNRILGYPDPDQQTSLAEGIRIIKRFNATRLMNNVGISQLQEFGGAIGTFGVRAALTHLPAFRKIVDGVDGSRQYLNRLGREIEGIGLGVDNTGGFRWANPWSSDDVPFMMPNTPGMRKLDEYSKKAEDLTYAMSGMNFIRRKQELAVAAMFIQKIGDLAADLQKGKAISRGWVSRLRQLGLDDVQIKDIAFELRGKGTFEDSLFYRNGKIARLNMSAWDNQEASKAFERAIYRFTKKTIQDRTLGNEWKFMRNPLLSLIFQFRPFMFQAWSNHTLHNIHMRDPTMVYNFTWSIVWAAAIRALQVNALSLTKNDGGEWRQKELSPAKLASVGFQRAAWASLVPSAVDTTLETLGQGGLFQERNSGTASSFFDNPTLGFLRSASRGLGGVANSFIDGRELTQPEVRSLISTLPWSNGMAVQIPLQGLIRNLPEKAPRPENRFWSND
jgi:hypothetical protein